MTAEFKLVGLSKGRRATLELLHTDRETFWAKVDMAEDRFEAMFNYCKHNWKDIKIAEVECDYLTEEGIPYNAVMKNFREKIK
jgi:hypothetical protein